MTASPLTPLEQSIAAYIAGEAAKQSAAVAVWLFGSRARGASTENSDFDVAVEFSCPETPALRDWIEKLRQRAEEPVAEQWPGFLDLLGLYAGDPDPRLARRVRAEGSIIWRRSKPADVPAETAAATPVGQSNA